MSRVIPHFLSCQLTKRPRLPESLSGYIQYSPSDKHFTIRGDVTGAPTVSILDALIDQSVMLKTPSWNFSLRGDLRHACAYVIDNSRAGDQRDIRILNDQADFVDPAMVPIEVRLRPGCDARLSKKPHGPFALVGSNLLVSTSTLKALAFTASGAVLVAGKTVGWHAVQPPACSILDPLLCFSPADPRPFRTHLANIAKAQANLTFGVATESEGWGDKLLARLYLIDMVSAARLVPVPRQSLGDATLAPVFPNNSPEGQLVRSITERMRRLFP